MHNLSISRRKSSNETAKERGCGRGNARPCITDLLISLRSIQCRDKSDDLDKANLCLAVTAKQLSPYCSIVTELVTEQIDVMKRSRISRNPSAMPTYTYICSIRISAGTFCSSTRVTGIEYRKGALVHSFWLIFFFLNRCRSFEDTQLPFKPLARRSRGRGDPGNFPSYASTASCGKERRGDGTGMRESLSNSSNELMFSCQLVDGNGVLPSRRGKDDRGRPCSATSMAGS